MKLLLGLMCVVCMSYAQEGPATASPASAPTVAPESPVAASTAPAVIPAPDASGRQYSATDRKRILGIIPNYRTTSVDAKDIVTLTTTEKFKLATRDAFDPGAYFTTALLTGLSHWEQQYYPSIPLGAKGYGWRYGLNFVDNVGSTYFIEAIVPSMTHQDPRYFRLGQGPIKKRVGHMFVHLVVARSDSGGRMFNVAEIGGNLAAASLGNLYYPADQRTFTNTAVRWGVNIGTDLLSNAGREFWPDLSRLLGKAFSKSQSGTPHP